MARLLVLSVVSFACYSAASAAINKMPASAVLVESLAPVRQHDKHPAAKNRELLNKHSETASFNICFAN